MTASQFSLRDWIVIHITYRDVFNAPVNGSDLRNWIGQANSDRLKFELGLLLTTGVLEWDGQENYCLAGRGELFRHQASRKKLSQKSLRKHKTILRWLRYFPLVRFIGISGSIAANNATIEKIGHRKNAVDLDIFIITSKNALWMVCYFERLMTNILTVFLKGKYTLCFNYSMDGSFLEIHNKGLYTATELYNLKPVYNSHHTYQKLLQANRWVEQYYPDLKCEEIIPRSATQFFHELLSLIFYPFNVVMYIGFHFSRVLKRQSLQPLKEISFSFKPNLCHCLKRTSPPYGGYEMMIVDHFEKRLKERSDPLFRFDLYRFLFPSRKFNSGADQKNLNVISELFTKYSLPKPL